MRAALRRPDGTLIELTETVDLVLGREDVDESFGDRIHISRKERGQVSVRYENGSWRVAHRTRSDIPSGWQAGGAEEWELLKSNYSRELNHGDRIALNKTFDPATIFTFLEQDGSRSPATLRGAGIGESSTTPSSPVATTSTAQAASPRTVAPGGKAKARQPQAPPTPPPAAAAPSPSPPPAAPRLRLLRRKQRQLRRRRCWKHVPRPICHCRRPCRLRSGPHGLLWGCYYPSPKCSYTEEEAYVEHGGTTDDGAGSVGGNGATAAATAAAAMKATSLRLATPRRSTSVCQSASPVTSPVRCIRRGQIVRGSTLSTREGAIKK